MSWAARELCKPFVSKQEGMLRIDCDENGAGFSRKEVKEN